MWAFRLLMALAVLGCIAASATFAFEFGWTRGATDVHRWTYALAGVALDLLKSGLPIFGAMAWHDSKPARSLACWLVFTVLTGLSLWCAHGTTATQLAEKFANQAVASVAQTSKQATLDRLRKQRDALTFTETSAETVETAEDAVAAATEQANAERARGGCRDFCRQREKEEREARKALLQAQTDRAATIKAADLDIKIRDAEAALSAVDVKAAVKEADPQSARHGQGDRRRSEHDRRAFTCRLRRCHRTRERRRLRAGVRARRRASARSRTAEPSFDICGADRP